MKYHLEKLLNGDKNWTREPGYRKSWLKDMIHSLGTVFEEISKGSNSWDFSLQIYIWSMFRPVYDDGKIHSSINDEDDKLSFTVLHCSD